MGEIACVVGVRPDHFQVGHVARSRRRSCPDEGAAARGVTERSATLEGMGLIGMTRRAIWLGGRVDVNSRPGETTVRIAAPLIEPEGAGEDDIAAFGEREAA